MIIDDVCMRMHRVWESNVSCNIKVCLFQATVETVLLTDKGDGESSGRIYMHPATKVCPWDQMARSPDQQSGVLKHSASIRKTTSQEDTVCWSLTGVQTYQFQEIKFGMGF